MYTRIVVLLERLRASFWFLPSVMIFFGLLFGAAMPFVDQALRHHFEQGYKDFFSGSAEFSLAILSTIASSMIGVTGVVFSITIVVLVLASNQFGPRLIRNFMRDRGNQFVLGTFLTTFVYCLAVMRAVQSGFTEEGQTPIPHVSTTLAMLLALISLAVLIYFIHHIATSIQAPKVIAAVHRDFINTIDETFPHPAGEETSDSHAAAEFDMERILSGMREARPLPAGKTGYVSLFDMNSMIETAREHDLLIHVQFRAGQFISSDESIMRVAPRERATNEVLRILGDCYELELQRTLPQDPEFPLQQIVEIATRALSPGINDPFTALQCLDWIADGLIYLSQRKPLPPFCLDSDRIVRVVVHPTTFTSMTDSAFNTIRQSSRGYPLVMGHQLRAILRILIFVKAEQDRRHLLAHAESIMQQARTALALQCDLQPIERTYREVVQTVSHPV